MKIAYVSLGCPKNEVDLEIVLGRLAGEVEVVDDVKSADAVVLNTCAFIESAREESLEAFFELARHKQTHPGLRILMTGCMPQRYPKELAAALHEADALFPDRDAEVTAGRIRAFLGLPQDGQAGRFRISPRHYAYLRIADGCDNRCSYCAIPLIKGNYRSRPFEDIVDEAQRLVSGGVRELILVAQDTSFYGREALGNKTLPDLLPALNGIPDLQWIRLLYTHPAHWNQVLIDTVAGLEKVVKTIDLPLQHISKRILRRMGRRVTPEQIRDLLGRLREGIPGLALRTSLIVGFPGESEGEFSELLRFVDEARFERLGVFTYSHEQGTRAWSLADDVTAGTKSERQQEIQSLQDELSLERNRRLIGSIVQVMVDGYLDDEDAAAGRTAWDAPEIDGVVRIDSEVRTGRIYPVRIIDADDHQLYGRLRDE